MSREHYCGLWRSSAYEGMPYTDDFPEALLTFPEIIDGSVAQGRATEVTIQFEFAGPRCCATVTDNGKGLASLERFRTWASVKSAADSTSGHGLKKAMTKLEKDYEKAEWIIEFRKPNRDIVRITAPFMGPETSTVDVEDDELESKILMPSGTRWQMTFDRAVFGATANLLDKFAFSIRELIETRYSEDILRRVRFRLDVTEAGKIPVRMNSKNNAGQNVWHNFQWWINRMAGRARYLRNTNFRMDGCSFKYTAFHICDIVNTPFQRRFPRYSGCSRVHMSIGDRMIEAIPMYKLLGTRPSEFNGRIEFVKFFPKIVGDKMPAPCTTKVSFYEPDLVSFKHKYTLLRTEERTKSESKIAELEQSLAEAKAHHEATLI